MLQIIVLLVGLFAPRAHACCDCPPNPLYPDAPCCCAEE
jgi:hypothetical protein